MKQRDRQRRVRHKQRQFLIWLRQWLWDSLPARRGLCCRPIWLEPLERRELMAADAFLQLLGSAQNTAIDQSLLAPELVAAPPVVMSNLLQPEGEAADDLVAFAKALAATSTKFYGGAWCRFCSEQKRLFEDGAKYLPYIEVTNPDRTPNQIALDNNITTYPTWVFPDGSRLTGVQSLATISQRSGVAIPKTSNVDMVPIANVNVATGSPLHVPVDSYTPNGSAITYTVTSSNPNLISAQMVTNNRSLKISTDFGDMVFQLFEDKAPRATSRVIELAQSGFYTNSPFHRVIDGFMIQGGTSATIGGTEPGNFNDQFHLDLQHNRSGVLSFAKAGDDTNNSQFFITAGPTRHLDFNHSVFGQLIEGDATRAAINGTPTNASDRPINDVKMNEVTVFNDTENGLILLKRVGSGTGSANITVTATDALGNTTSRTFVATAIADTANGAPFLNDIPTLQGQAGVTLNHTLTSQDAEGDTVVYSVERVGSVLYDLSVNSQTGVVTLTPPANFSGQLQFLARVRQSAPSTTQDTFDSQLVTVQVTPAATLGLSLSAASDSGQSNSDRITNATVLTFNITGTTVGATVEMVVDGEVVGVATASSANTQVTVQNVGGIAQGNTVFTARQKVNNQVTSTSNTLTVMLDRTAPIELPASAFPSSAFIGIGMAVNLNHAEEGQGLRYAVENAPAGLTIHPTNGTVGWTPASGQSGAQSLTLVLTDLAGNERRQTFSIQVGQEPVMGVRLATVTPTGTAVNTIGVGQNFKVQIYVQDQRPVAERIGVFSAYVDLLFDPAIVQPIATSPISHVDPYVGSTKGAVGTGVVNGIGGLAGTSPLGPNERLLAEVTFTALAVGNAGLRTAMSNVDDTGLYGRNEDVTASEVNFGSSSFAVGLDYTVANDTFNFDEDSGQKTLNVLANDTAQSGVVLTIVEVSTPSGGGSVTIASGGKSLLYTSAANFHGAETLTYTVANAQGIRQTATVTLQITEVNDPPAAVDDALEVIQNSSLNVLDVLANDHQGVDAGTVESLTVISVTAGSQGGAVTIGPSGLNIRYSPMTGFVGTETFTYTLSDGRGGTDTAQVTVLVKPNVPPPTARDDSFTVLEDSALAEHDVLANDSPAQVGDTLKIKSVGSSTFGSTVAVSADGTRLVYRPAANLDRPEVVTYVVESSNGGTATGRVTFTITPVADPPTAVDDVLTVLSPQGQSQLDVLTNDFDVDTGDTFTITSVTQPAAGTGTVVISNNGRSISYTPPTNSFEGTATFSYTITDSTNRTDSASVTLTVRNFMPRSISGKVMFDQATSFYVLSSAPLQLTGTSLTGSTVNTTATIANDGSFSFSNLAPGQYQLTRQAIPFFNDVGQTIAIQSAIDGGDLTQNLIVSGTLHARHINIRDFLGSTFKRMLTAVVDQNGSASWMAPNGTWAGLSGVNFQLHTSNLLVSGVNTSQQNVSATIPLTHALLSRTNSQGRSLIKLHGDTSRFQLAPVTPTSTIAEGESSSDISSSSTGHANSQPITAVASLASGNSATAVRSGSSRASDVADMNTVDDEQLTSGGPEPMTSTSALKLLLSSNQQSLSVNHSETTDAALQQLLDQSDALTATGELDADWLDALANESA
ncbi:MAG: tandem-95 repeat protein [Pirellulaceae bacterium]|nr:tandem-95 repeat protein [Pirellulaceae bacterium]